jgi:citrate lyase subunit beta/citryl-CoA lyase
MNNNSATSGNSGPKIRSDCEATLWLRNEGGIVTDLRSRVQTLYGASIKKLCSDILTFFGINNALLKIDDSGALPFVISARVESVVKKLADTDQEFLPNSWKGRHSWRRICSGFPVFMSEIRLE